VPPQQQLRGQAASGASRSTGDRDEMSFKPEVIAESSGQWCGNALRFATREEAEANVRDLMMRWFAVRETRVVESDDPVNYRWDEGKLVEIATEKTVKPVDDRILE
jgi:hypothetical protein